MGRLLVVRHAQSAWNAAGRWQGWSDAPLSELGVKQAVAAGGALAAEGFAPDLIACSDLARSRRTAELIAVEVGYEGALVTDPDLREQDLGEWNGLSREELVARWPVEFEARQMGDLGTVPGGEPGAHFLERATRAVQRVAGIGADESLVVTHGGVVIALEKLLGTWSLGSRHNNLSGWWLESLGNPQALVSLGRVDLSDLRDLQQLLPNAR